MTIEDKIRDQKLQFDMYREAANISALSLGKIDKYNYPYNAEYPQFDWLKHRAYFLYF